MRKSVWLRGAVPEFGRRSTPVFRYLIVVFIGILWPYYAMYKFGSGNIWDKRYIWETYQEFSSFFLILLVILVVYAFQPRYILYNVQYRKSSWWKDTGVCPAEISSGITSWQSDKESRTRRQGLYGEYLAGMAAEKLLKSSKTYGHVLHGVLIPTDGGDGFTEADIVVVSEYGIHVDEVKYWRSAVVGNMSDTTWDGHGNPFFQNLYHCNMLLDYLYGQLSGGSGLRDRNMNMLVKNVVLFTTPVFDDYVTQDSSFYRSYGGFTENWYYLDGYIKDGFSGDKKVLTPQEVDEIAAILQKCVFREPEKSRRMEARKTSAGTKDSRNVFYCIKDMECPDGNGGSKTVVALEREVNGHKAYFDCNDQHFRAMPNMKETGCTYMSFTAENPGWEQAEYCSREVLDAFFHFSEGKDVWFDSMESNTEPPDEKFRKTDIKREILSLLNSILEPISAILLWIGKVIIKNASLYISILVAICTLAAKVVFVTDPPSNLQTSVFLYVAWILSPWGFPQIYYLLTEILSNFVLQLGKVLEAR